MTDSHKADAPSTRHRTVGELLRYLVVGGFNTLLDLSLFSLFAVVAGLQPLVANVASTCITLCISFVLNRRVVFRSSHGAWKTFVPFVTVTLFSGLVVQSAVIWGVIQLGDIVVPGAPASFVAPMAKVCAMGVGMISNFLGYRWLFSGAQRA